MSGTVAALAGQLRSALGGVLPALAALDDTHRRAKLAEALGLPGAQLSPGALLSRLGAPDADQAGDLWPGLLALLAGAADGAVPDWTFTVADVLAVTADDVQVLGETLPADGTITFSLHLGPLRLADVLHVRQDIDLVLTAPPAGQAAAAWLRLAVRGVRLTLPTDPLIRLLAPGGPVLEGDVEARFDAQGARFGGGGKNGVSLPLRSAPPGLRAPTLYLAPAPASGAGRGLRFTAAFGASLLGLADGTVDGIGSELTPGGAATPVPPTGLGLSLSVGPARGRGFLERRGDEYRGALELALGVVEVRAFAILRPQQPALLVALSAHFTPAIELGLAFTLNAVGGIVGIGHAIDRAGLGAAVQSGHLDRVLFPDDAARAAAQILDTLASVFPARRGAVVVGPILRLGWGRPFSFVTADLGIVLDLSGGDIALLGRLRVALPAPEAPILDLKASVAGFVDSGAGLVELVGDLAGSRLLTAGIDGGIAVRLQTGSGTAFVLSAGGFHPGFPVPAGFPVPRRLSLTIADSPTLRIVFSGYFAVTPGTVQAGATLNVVVGTRDTGVSGQLGFDALLRWEPSFGVVLDLHGSFHLRFDGLSLCSVGLRVRVEGPTPCWHVAGRASVSLFFVDVDFPFDEHWGCTAVAAAPPAPDIALLLERELDNPRSWEPVLPEGATGLAVLRRDTVGESARLLHPLGRLRFSQRVVPLELKVTRFGPGRLPTPTAYKVTVRFATGPAVDSPVQEQFARADFFDLTDDEKLTQPAFEALRSGSELTPPADGPAVPRRTVDVRYETKWIGKSGEPQQGASWLLGADHLAAALLHGAVATSAIRGDRIRYHGPPVKAALKPVMFAVARAGTLTEAGLLRKATFTEAALQFDAPSGRTALLHVIPAHELKTVVTP